jgi:hypothetical protein
VTPERRRILIYTAGALLLVAVALLVFGYRMLLQDQRDESMIVVPKPPTLGLPGSALITSSPDGDATSTPDATDSRSTSGSSSNKALTPSEAAAIQAELSAIEKALDSMSMPNDADFKDIESGLQ